MTIRIEGENAAFAGLTIKKVLLDKLGFSRAAVTALKKREDGILLNGEHRTVRALLAEGDELVLHCEDAESSEKITPSPGEIDILYEDANILCVNKPPFMAVHPSKKLQDDTLAGRILYHRAPLVFRAAGRLDKDTSGVVITSKTKVVGAKFSENILHHRVKKEYLLLSHSEKDAPREGEIALCIRRDPESYITRVCFPADGTEKPSETALTRFRLIASKTPYHLFLASPVTGRTHQLRAHFSAIGFPIEGDTLYGTSSPVMPRQALHAMRLTFPHPVSGEETAVFAPLHEDFAEAVGSIFGEEALEKIQSGKLFL